VIYAVAFAASFIFIALKSWQQLNVVRQAYAWILPTSMCMALCEVYVVAQVASQGFGWIVIAIGLGGGLGSTTATYVHFNYLKGK
jgi:NAD/NADP transhydrogenase beta subunit